MAIIGKTRQLVPDEPVEVQHCTKITDHLKGIYRLHPKIHNGKLKDVSMITGWTCKHNMISTGCAQKSPGSVLQAWVSSSYLCCYLASLLHVSFIRGQFSNVA